MDHTLKECVPQPSVNLSVKTLIIYLEVYLGLLGDSKSIQVDNEDEPFHSLYTYANLYPQFLSLTLRPIYTQVHSVLLLEFFLVPQMPKSYPVFSLLSLPQ